MKMGKELYNVMLAVNIKAYNIDGYQLEIHRKINIIKKGFKIHFLYSMSFFSP